MRTMAIITMATASVLTAQVPAWNLSSLPTLDIGNDAHVETQFNGVSGVVRMPGGEIVVANGLSQELRVFSPAGAYQKTLTPAGRAGVMRSLDRIWRAGDTIFAAEVLPAESGVWVFTLAGFVGRHPIGAANAGGVYPIDRFPDGRFVVTAAPRRPNQQDGRITSIDSTPVGILSLTEVGAPRWVGSLKNETVMASVMGQRGRGARLPVQYAFGRTTAYAVSGERLWIGDSETGTITQHASSGRGLAVFAAPTRPRPLDTATIARLRMSVLGDAPSWNDRARIDASYAVPYPRNAPRFARFLPGVNGEMWIETFREDPATPRAYVIVDRNGSAIGRVTAPPRARLLEVGSADVMGVLTDEDGLEHVVRYSLRR